MIRWINTDLFRDNLLAELPKELAPSAQWMFRKDYNQRERKLAKQIESFRGGIASLAANGTLTSMSSPMPGSFELDDEGRSQGAPLQEASVSAHAQTGVGATGGLLLRRLVDGLGMDHILELGTNTGMSGAYMLSAERRPHLTTVEGSAELCAVAAHCLGEQSSQFRQMNALFDEAIDTLVSAGARFDAVFVDGQHEEKATIHYAERVRPLLKPGGVLIFDDIYWSRGMLAA